MNTESGLEGFNYTNKMNSFDILAIDQDETCSDRGDRPLGRWIARVADCH